MLGSRQGEPTQRPVQQDVPRVVRRKLSWLRRGGRAVLVCAECDLTGGPFGIDEANYLAALHDQLQHGGRSHARTS